MAETPEEVLLERKPEQRLKWKKHIEYILSSIGYAVGLMNVWRFPYVCYEHGGAAFLIPYTIFLVIVGLPIYFMEAIVGQYPSRSPAPAYGLVPCMAGVGITQVVVSFVIATYYVVILVWATVYFYFGISLNDLPWSSCNNSEWGQDHDTCYVKSGKPLVPPMCTGKEESENETCKHWEAASVQFFNTYVLQKKSDTTFQNIGPILPQLALLLILMWFIIFLCISKGIQTSGKVVYVTALFPYFVLAYFCIVGFSLEGASDGLLYFIKDYKKIVEPKVWQAALTQMFLSCSIGLGGVIMYASFNEFQNRLFRDAFIVVTVDFVTSIMATCAVFSVIGFYSRYIHMPFEKTFQGGVSLMFLVLPAAVSVMPVPKLTIMLLMLMVFTLGIDSQFVLVETVIVTIEDIWPSTRRYRTTLGIAVCTSAMIIGLLFVSRGGILWLAMVDKFIEITIIWSVFWELIAVFYMYGVNRFADDLFLMNGFRLNCFWRIILAFIDPIIVLAMFIVAIYNFESLKEEDDYEPWANYFGLGFCLLIFLILPSYALYNCFKMGQTKNVKASFKPAEDWGPADAKYKAFYQEWVQDRTYDSNPIKQLFVKEKLPSVPPLKDIH